MAPIRSNRKRTVLSELPDCPPGGDAQDKVEASTLEIAEMRRQSAELCMALRVAGRWIMKRASGSKDEQLLSYLRETLRSANEPEGRALEERLEEGKGWRDRRVVPGKVISIRARKG